MVHSAAALIANREMYSQRELEMVMMGRCSFAWQWPILCRRGLRLWLRWICWKWKDMPFFAAMDFGPLGSLSTAELVRIRRTRTSNEKRAAAALGSVGGEDRQIFPPF